MNQIPRTYIYYSDDKILQYQQQVPSSRWKRATHRLSRVSQVGVTVLGSGAQISLGPPSSEPIIRMLQTVCMDLSDRKLIGTFDEPKEYIYGKLVFNYGFFEMVDPPVFFLIGVTDQTIVALGGSKKHVRGFRNREIPVPDHAQGIIMEPDLANVLYASEAALPGVSSEALMAAVPDGDFRAGYVAMMYKNWDWQGKKMEYEVLARKELYSRVSPPFVESPMNVLIGSPVFVAQT